MTNLPQFSDAERYVLSGTTLNLFCRAIQERTPLAGEGLLATELPQGVMLRLDPSADLAGSSSKSSSGSSSASNSSSSSSGSNSDSDSGSSVDEPPGGSSSSGSGSGSSGSQSDSGSQPGLSSGSPDSGSGSDSGSSRPSGSGSGDGSGDPPGSPGSSGGGSNSGSGGPSSGGGSNGASKSAIVAIETSFGEVEWIGWFCVERDVTVFEIVRDVPINKAGEGSLRLPLEMVQSCEPGSLKVASAMAVGTPAMVTASVEGQRPTRADAISWHVQARASWRGKIGPSAVRVRIEGIRRGHTEQWPRFTEAQAASNNAFWDAARTLSVA